MKVYYNSDSLNSCTDNESIFAHREVSQLHEERVKIKNAVLETIVDTELDSLTKREKEYWLLYRQGIKNKEISRIMNIELVSCRQLKCSANKKIIAFSKKLTENL